VGGVTRVRQNLDSKLRIEDNVAFFTLHLAFLTQIMYGRERGFDVSVGTFLQTLSLLGVLKT
jgi:hypothetical protein